MKTGQDVELQNVNKHDTQKQNTNVQGTQRSLNYVPDHQNLTLPKSSQYVMLYFSMSLAEVNIK
jgi:hypothetical protein